MFLIVTGAAIIGFVISRGAMGALWGIGLMGFVFSVAILALVHGTFFFALWLLSGGPFMRGTSEKTSKLAVLFIAAVFPALAQAQPQSVNFGQLPPIGATNKSGMQMDVNPLGTEGLGYREVELTIRFATPTKQDAVLDASIFLTSPYYRRQRLLSASESFLIPANSSVYQCRVMTPHYEPGYQYGVEIHINGRRIPELCSEAVSPGIAVMFDGLTRITFLADRYPRWNSLVELLALEGIANNRQLSVSSFNVLEDGTPYVYAAANQTTPNQLRTVKQIPTVSLQPLRDAHTNWIGYTGTDIVCISLQDLLSLERSNASAFLALRLWVWHGGSLWVTHTQKNPQSLAEIDKRFDHAGLEVDLSADNKPAGAPERPGQSWAWLPRTDVGVRVMAMDAYNGSIELDPTGEWIKPTQPGVWYYQNLLNRQSPSGQTEPPFVQGTVNPRGGGYSVSVGIPSATPFAVPAPPVAPPPVFTPSVDQSSEETSADSQQTDESQPTEQATEETTQSELPTEDESSEGGETEQPPADETTTPEVDAQDTQPPAAESDTADQESSQEENETNPSERDGYPGGGDSGYPDGAESEFGKDEAYVPIGQPTSTSPPLSFPRTDYARRRCGLGQIIAIHGDPYGGSHAQWTALLVDTHRTNPVASTGVSGVKPCPDFWSFMLPGVGLVPVNAFRVLITLFAIGIGPLNYWLLKRYRRIQWMIVTVPLTAALISGALFVYAMIADGLQTRIRSKSLTLINQKTGDATCWSRITYYAAVSPWQGLTFSQSTAVRPILSRARMYNEASPNLGVSWQGEEQRLSSRWLPPRNPTQLLTQRCRTTAARVTVKEQGGSVVIGNGLATNIKQIVLLDSQGLYFFAKGVAPGATTRMQQLKDSGEAASLMEKWFAEFESALPYQGITRNNYSWFGFNGASYNPFFYNSVEPNWGASLQEEAFSDITKRGSTGWGKQTYFALVDQSPEFEPGVQSAAESGSLHIVVGRYESP